MKVRSASWNIKYQLIIFSSFASPVLGTYVFGRQIGAYIGFLLPAMFALILITSCMIVDLRTKKATILFACILAINFTVGVYASNNPKDMLSDALFFTMPLLGYLASHGVTSSQNIENIKYSLFCALSVVLVFGIVEKIVILALTGNMVHYGGPYLFVPFLYYIVLVDGNIRTAVVRYFIYILYFLGPLLVASKTLMLSTIAYFVLLKGRFLIFFIVFSVFVFVGYLVNFGAVYDTLSVPFAIQRLVSFAILFQSDGVDFSTSARSAEVNSIVSTISSGSVLHMIVGHGLGAVYFPSDGLPIDGLSIENSRGDGYHHAHMGWLVVFFRHGLLGLILYASPMIIMMTNPGASNKLQWRAFSLISIITMFMGWSFVYGCLIFGVFFALFECERKGNTLTPKLNPNIFAHHVD